jgi:hypothetical protein
VRVAADRLSVVVGAAVALVAATASAQCIAPITNPDDAVAISPFGVDRSAVPGASAGWHLGLDLQEAQNAGANGVTSHLYAPSDALVTVHPNAGGAGNIMVFVRADGTQIEFLHMDRYAPKFMSAKSMPVTAGEYVGELGGTGGPYAKHLHIQMKIPSLSAIDYRGSMFASGPGAKAKANSPFTADRLSDGYKPSSGMVFVDPQYWLNRQFQWSGNMAKYASQGLLMSGGKTMPPTCSVAGGGNPMVSAQQDAINAMGGDPGAMTNAQLAAKGFQDGDLIGAIDAPSFTDYADMSEQDIVATEAGRRMTDHGWGLQLSGAGRRGLWIEVVRINATKMWINSLIAQKKERIEAMYAALVALKVKRLNATAGGRQ